MSFMNRMSAHMASMINNSTRRQVRSDDLLLDGPVEVLEARLLLAGNVTFSVSGNNLTVIGSDDNDCVEIDTDGSEITVNGVSTEIQADQLNNVTIKTKDGADEITIGGTTTIDSVLIGGKLKIISGDDDDYVTIYDTTVAGKTTLKTGGDDDTVNTYDATYEGKVKVVTGDGEDQVCVALGSMDGGTGVVVLGGAGAYDVRFASAVKINLGSDEDRLNLGIVAMPVKKVALAAEPFGTVFFDSKAAANGGSDFDLLRIAGNLIDPDLLPSDAAVSVKNFEIPS